MKYVVFMCYTIKILIVNWPRTRKFSQLFTGREDSCFWLLTLYVQFLCSDWSKFNRWCSILNLVYFDIWSWQSFVSTFDVLTVFFHWMYKMKFKVGNPISDGVVFVFTLLWCVRGLQSLKRYRPYLIPFRSCISNGKPGYLLCLMFVFCI